MFSHLELGIGFLLHSYTGVDLQCVLSGLGHASFCYEVRRLWELPRYPWSTANLGELTQRQIFPVARDFVSAVHADARSLSCLH